MDTEPVAKRLRRGRVPRQFSEPFLSEEQVKVMLGPPKRLPRPKPILAAVGCINHRLSRAGRQQYLVGWADKSIKDSWEDVDDISPDLTGAYLAEMAKKCPLITPGLFLIPCLSSCLSRVFLARLFQRATIGDRIAVQGAV